MRVAARYSHLNGEEYLLVHRETLWTEVRDVIAEVDAFSCKTKTSREKTKWGKTLFSPGAMNDAFKTGFRSRGWSESRNTFWSRPTKSCCVEHSVFPKKNKRNG